MQKNLQNKILFVVLFSFSSILANAHDRYRIESPWDPNVRAAFQIPPNPQNIETLREIQKFDKELNAKSALKRRVLKSLIPSPRCSNWLEDVYSPRVGFRLEGIRNEMNMIDAEIRRFSPDHVPTALIERLFDLYAANTSTLDEAFLLFADEGLRVCESSDPNILRLLNEGDVVVSKPKSSKPTPKKEVSVSKKVQIDAEVHIKKIEQMELQTPKAPEKIEVNPTTTRTESPKVEPSQKPSVLTAERQSERLAKSPYPPYSLLDITGLAPGSLAQDPTTSKIFKVPPRK